MTAALVLMSEARRLAAGGKDPSVASAAMTWLRDSPDRDRDGLPGWGLPHDWDAFNDGIGAAGDRNPAHHPYTVTTALVLDALLDWLALGREDATGERALTGLMRQVVNRWCRSVFTRTGRTGFFWYSPFRGDAQFCPNVSAMFLGTAARLLAERPNLMTRSESRSVQERVDQAAEGLVDAVRWDGDDPYWRYIEPSPRGRPNDAVHHAYTLWGLEMYRTHAGTVHLPWSTEQAVASLDRFRLGGRLVEFPRLRGTEANPPERPMRLWGAGMSLAFLARHGPAGAAERWYATLLRDYGPLPALSLAPRANGRISAFYARHAAHVLLGLAELMVRESGRPSLHAERR